MSQTNIIYANSRVAVLSVKLISLDRFLRMASAVSVEEAFKILLETQFGSETARDNYKSMLIGEETALHNLLLQLGLGKVFTEYLLCPTDYLNAKILMKSKYLRLNEYNLSSFGSISIDEIKKILIDEYIDLPKYMQDACQQIDEQFADGNRSPVVIDYLLDQALNQHLNELLINLGNNLLIEYNSLKCDCTNLITLLRAISFKLSEKALNQMLISCGNIDKEFWLSLLNEPIESIINKLEDYSDLSQMLVKCGIDLTLCESYIDSLLKNKIVEFKNDVSTFLPVVNYYYSKKAEIDNVRLIMTCLRNNVDKQQITMRLREIYV